MKTVVLDGTSISIVQQPRLARMSGINDSRTRRILDPPLILLLSPNRHNLVSKVNLYTEHGKNADYLVDKTSSDRIANLNGTLVTSPLLLYDTDDMIMRKTFFVFAKLSVRQAGRYFLRIKVMKGLEGDDPKQVVSVDTDVFEVFPPHSYPGNSATTALSSIFQKQGLHIRGGNFAGKNSGVSE